MTLQGPSRTYLLVKVMADDSLYGVPEAYGTPAVGLRANPGDQEVNGNHCLRVVVTEGPPGLGLRVVAAQPVLARADLADVNGELEQLAVLCCSLASRVVGRARRLKMQPCTLKE
jgi:hypothetical protein